MARWIEIPAHRILEIDPEEIRRDFKPIDKNGQKPAEGEIPYRLIRTDGKVFKIADFVPIQDSIFLYLQEI